MYVEGVKRHSKYTVGPYNIFLLITFLIFNQFSIRKKFLKSETEGLYYIRYVEAYRRGRKLCLEIPKSTLITNNQLKIN